MNKKKEKKTIKPKTDCRRLAWSCLYTLAGGKFKKRRQTNRVSAISGKLFKLSIPTILYLCIN